MSNTIKLKVKRLPHCHALPSYATPGSAGLDLSAAISEPIELKPGERMKMPTGIQIEIPDRHQGQVVPRSGLAAKAGISLTNCVGTIDSDYRGELCVLLINHGQESYTFEPGERVAQLVVMPIPYVEVEEVEDLAVSEVRGAGGFGSTGKSIRRVEVGGQV
ncbi:MAG TPA: dUTP diphosphatase [Drouetiella sp.]